MVHGVAKSRAGLSDFTFTFTFNPIKGIPRSCTGKEPTGPMQETKEMWVRSLGQEDPLEEGMATHSSILAWKTLWTEEAGELESIGSQRVGHE